MMETGGVGGATATAGRLGADEEDDGEEEEGEVEATRFAAAYAAVNLACALRDKYDRRRSR